MTLQTAMRSWDVHRYRPGDERDLLDLFESVFGFRRSLEHWNWQFGRNPYGGPYITLARRRDDGKLVGSHVFMPFPLNVNGVRVIACQSLDLMVHADYRGQGIFGAAGEEGMRWCRREGVAAVVAFPNVASYPGFVRTLKWHRLLVPHRFTRVLSIEKALGRAMPWRPAARAADAIFRLGQSAEDTFRRLGGATDPPSWRLGIDDAVPASYEGLWEGWRTQQVLSIWKDPAYLRWRYDANPDRPFTHFRLDDDAETIALAIAAEVDGVALLCELIVRDRQVSAGRRLALEVCRHFARRGARSVRFLAHDSGFVRDALVGFRETSAAENVFVGRALDDPELDALISAPQNWALAYGDGDFV